MENTSYWFGHNLDIRERQPNFKIPNDRNKSGKIKQAKFYHDPHPPPHPNHHHHHHHNHHQSTPSLSPPPPPQPKPYRKTSILNSVFVLGFSLDALLRSVKHFDSSSNFARLVNWCFEPSQPPGRMNGPTCDITTRGRETHRCRIIENYNQE